MRPSLFKHSSVYFIAATRSDPQATHVHCHLNKLIEVLFTLVVLFKHGDLIGVIPQVVSAAVQMNSRPLRNVHAGELTQRKHGAFIVVRRAKTKPGVVLPGDAQSCASTCWMPAMTTLSPCSDDVSIKVWRHQPQDIFESCCTVTVVFHKAGKYPLRQHLCLNGTQAHSILKILQHILFEYLSGEHLCNSAEASVISGRFLNVKDLLL